MYPKRSTRPVLGAATIHPFYGNCFLSPERAGRRPGTPNKATAAVKERIEQVLSDLDTTLTADRARHGQFNGQTVVALTTPRTRLGRVLPDNFRKNNNTYPDETNNAKKPPARILARGFFACKPNGYLIVMLARISPPV